MSKIKSSLLTVRVTKTLIEDNISIMNLEDAKTMEFKEGDKIVLTNLKDGRKIISNVVISVDLVDKGYILLPENISSILGVKQGDNISIQLAPYPSSIGLIKKKMRGEKLSHKDISTIIKEIVSYEIGKPEIIAFALAQEYIGMDLDEIEGLCKAMYETGEFIEFNVPTYDKHSIGGVPGNKVSLLIVPIVASAGLTIPKTSSRAITSPSGTADTMEVIANVTFTSKEFKEIVEKVGGAIVWGGNLNLAPADDIIIRAEKILGIDPLPQMLASIMSKKMAAGIKNMVLDIPVGKETKMESMEKGEEFANMFIELGKRVGINVNAALTYGEQPVGHAIGPALEAWEALEALINGGPASLIEKSCSLAGILLEMSGLVDYGKGYDVSKDILESRKAYNKMREIIEAQGGDPNIKPDDIEFGKYKYTMYAPVDGYITKVSNKAINIIARAAGAPKDKGAGVFLHGKRGYKVRKGDPILDVYAERSTKLQDAVSILRSLNPIIIEGMLLKTIPGREIYKLRP